MNFSFSTINTNIKKYIFNKEEKEEKEEKLNDSNSNNILIPPPPPKLKRSTHLNCKICDENQSDYGNKYCEKCGADLTHKKNRYYM